MRILLSDGTGLTSRQAATLLARAGHFVDVLAPTRIGAAGLTRHVRRVHRTPPFGLDPEGWLDACLAVLRLGAHDVLLPTQEQVAILARDAVRVRELGVQLPVPPYPSLVRVQDKVAQLRTLRALGLSHPRTDVVYDSASLRERCRPPAFVKTAIGTASTGVRRVDDRAALDEIVRHLDRDDQFADGIVVQEALAGPLAMVQAIYARGELVAWHANERVREGVNGGACVKCSLALPAARDDLVTLGRALDWHGALSLDAILTPSGPSWIDINPRLVEPGNAAAAGTDLVGTLLATARCDSPTVLPPSHPGVRTHQLLLGVLGSAQHDGRRRAIVRELADGLRRRGPYTGSREELTPLRGDPLAAVPVLAAAALTLTRPRLWRELAGGAVSAYALTPAAWRQITSASAPSA